MISGQYMNSVPMSIVARRSLAAVALLLSLVTCLPAHAQFGFGFGNRQGVVGGVSVDAAGTVRSATTVEQQGRLSELRKATSKPANDLAVKTELRMVSLTKLQAEIEKALAANEPFSEDVLFLAGLQRIEYVFVYPDRNDIVLAGPAEGWIVREDATVVGETSGRPVLQLEDLIVAMRSTKATQQQPMSVSIDPTAEGQVRVRELLKQARGGPGFDPRRMEPALQEAFGPQVVSLTAIPKDSRMANTLVAADYRMKRLAMNLEESPVAGLPSYMEMIRNGGLAAGTQPRWWMACDYDAILHSEDMLAWKLSGRGIKAMTEEEIVDSTGSRSQTGKTNKLAQKWSDLFTEKFDELCTYNAAFGDLRNLMDLNIVATVIDGHELERVAGCDFGLLKGTAGSLQTPQWQTPKTITPECSFIRGRSGWTVSASGGVEINAWKIVSKQSKVDSSVQTVRAKAEADGGHWWWN